MYKTVAVCCVLFFSTSFAAPDAGEMKIIDSRHYSSVFGETRNYRVFLPPDYAENPQKRFPVIYFFHGWSQRYFGITRGGGYDKGDDNDGDNIANYVAEHDVIVVKWDGFNIREGDDYYLRPYNISPVETHRQFPLYFPELVSHIDTHYRTVPDREQRAVSGLSMGGFMTFWIGGKYPDMVCAAGNFCGSPEFRIGPKDFPVEYRHIDMYNNYGGVRLRLNYGTDDFIRAYHRDMNAVFPHILDNYEYGVYKAAHSTCGMSEMFDFIMETFENPLPKPETWHHIDVYPDFSVWGWSVNSDRTSPGFTVLENVNERGFRSSVREFVPDGETMPYVTVSVTTPPAYKNNTPYIINDINLTKEMITTYPLRSDDNGQLTFTLDGYPHDIGITEAGGSPNLTAGSHTIDNMNHAAPSKNVEMSVRFLNKGGATAEAVTAELSAARDNVTVISGQAKIGNIGVNEITASDVPFVFQVNDNDINAVKLLLVMNDRNGGQWSENIVLPVRADTPDLTDVAIADGREYTVSEAGTTKVSFLMGAGNGDGVANPGESIVVLVRDNTEGIFRRCHLFTSDRYVNPGGINARVSDDWSRLDHVGASQKVSVPLIASDCPQGHVISFSAEYWLPDYPDHIIGRGNVDVTVTGKDTTPPLIRWAETPRNNTIRVKITDGGNIRHVKAVFHYRPSNYTSTPHAKFEVRLYDNGDDGDIMKGDSVFSARIPERTFGLYTVEIEAVDEFGNTRMESFPDIVTIY